MQNLAHGFKNDCQNQGSTTFKSHCIVLAKFLTTSELFLYYAPLKSKAFLGDKFNKTSSQNPKMTLKRAVFLLRSMCRNPQVFTAGFQFLKRALLNSTGIGRLEKADFFTFADVLRVIKGANVPKMGTLDSKRLIYPPSMFWTPIIAL